MEEEVWEQEFQGVKHYGAIGPRDVLIIVSSESLEGPEIVPRKEGSLTEDDKASLRSQGIPPESWADEGKLMQARYTTDKKYTVVAVEYNQQAEYVRGAIGTLFTNTTKPGVIIHYIGPGRRNTGDWCFKDGFITFDDILSLHATRLCNRGKPLGVFSDCSYSGRWADLACEYMDKQKIQPCAHSAKAANALLQVTPSSLASEVPRSMEFSARRLKNDKNFGTFYTDSVLSEFKNTYVMCKEGATIQDPCSLPPDYTWQKHCQGERIWRDINRMGDDSHQWALVLVVDDKETIRVLNAMRNANEPFDTTDYGEVLASGPGVCPPKEVQERFIKEYPTVAILKRTLRKCYKPGNCEHHTS